MNLKDETLKELKDICKKNNLKKYSKLDKASLIKFIKKNMKGGLINGDNNLPVATEINTQVAVPIKINKDLIKKTLDELYDDINKLPDKYALLDLTGDKIIVITKSALNINLTTKFQKLDLLNTYLINLYKQNKNKNIKIIRLKINKVCKKLNLEIIFISTSSLSASKLFGTKKILPSLLIDLKKLMSKIIVDKKLINTNDVFGTLKKYIKNNAGKRNQLGIRLDNSQKDYSCIADVVSRSSYSSSANLNDKKKEYSMFDNK